MRISFGEHFRIGSLIFLSLNDGRQVDAVAHPLVVEAICVIGVNSLYQRRAKGQSRGP
jgi:hypothetical protein